MRLIRASLGQRVNSRMGGISRENEREFQPLTLQAGQPPPTGPQDCQEAAPSHRFIQERERENHSQEAAERQREKERKRDRDRQIGTHTRTRTQQDQAMRICTCPSPKYREKAQELPNLLKTSIPKLRWPANLSHLGNAHNPLP